LRLKQHRHLSLRVNPCLPVAIAVLEMILLMLVVLEGYNMTHETNPAEVVSVSDAKHVNAGQQTSQAMHCIIVSFSFFGS